MKKMKMHLFLLFSTIALTGCPTGSGAANPVTKKPAADIAQRSDGETKAPRDSTFAPAEGVVVFIGNEQDLKAVSGMITIFGADGRPLKVIDHDDDSLGSLAGEEGDFYPLMFSNGASRDFDIQMRAVRKSKDWIEVVTHETKEPGTTGFVRSSDPLFRFMAWDMWVKGHFNIRFAAASNPVLDAPDGGKKDVSIQADALIRPGEVKGDWVLIRWTKHEPDEPSVERIASENPDNVGWIRWRRDGKILIEEYYP